MFENLPQVLLINSGLSKWSEDLGESIPAVAVVGGFSGVMEPAISPEIVIVQKSLNAVVLSCFPFTWRLVRVYSILNTGP
jgi:hypothetical protein